MLTPHLLLTSVISNQFTLCDLSSIFFPLSGFDYNKLREEAQFRWLKPAEILYILQNHERYPITQAAPQQPPSNRDLLLVYLDIIQ